MVGNRVGGAASASGRVRAERTIVGDGVEVRRALPRRGFESVGPFVFLDEIGPIPVPERGVPPHPHAGIEVITYVISGAVEHRDSAGHASVITSGGAQWINSGRGILHAEFFRKDVGPLFHGVQLWTKLPHAAEDRDPTYRAVEAAAIPGLKAEGVAVRLIAGVLPSLASDRGPVVLAQGALLADVAIEAGKSVTLAVDPAHELGIYVLEGEVAVGNGSDADPLPRSTLASLTRSDVVELNAGADGSCRLLLLGGEPAERPLVFSGPFVFGSTESVRKAERDYHAGRMGRLDDLDLS